MKHKLISVVIDDEPDAVDFITSIIREYCPGLDVRGKAHNVKEGVQLIREISPNWYSWMWRCQTVQALTF
jgi:hypothetical protein